MNELGHPTVPPLRNTSPWESQLHSFAGNCFGFSFSRKPTPSKCLEHPIARAIGIIRGNILHQKCKESSSFFWKEGMPSAGCGRTFSSLNHSSRFCSFRGGQSWAPDWSNFKDTRPISRHAELPREDVPRFSTKRMLSMSPPAAVCQHGEYPTAVFEQFLDLSPWHRHRNCHEEDYPAPRDSASGRKLPEVLATV